MLRMAAIVLVLLSQLTSTLAAQITCVPNTHFILNERICKCDHNGWWTESNCININRRSCLPGQVQWHGCKQCICQENGTLQCNDDACDNNEHKTESLDMTWCTPFRSYYFNCSICVCPSSGLTAEARCAADNSCQEPPTAMSISSNKNTCIPRVMYLFPCLRCQCSDAGYFVLEECIETCHQTQKPLGSRRCLSRTFYRKDCNVCWCPDNSVPDDNFCTQSQCETTSMFKPLSVLRTKENNCRPYTFVESRCFYCTCNAHGNVNENTCLEQKCIKSKHKYDVQKVTCSPGEVVPRCSECYCLSKGVTNKTYCTDTCSYQSKLDVLQKVLWYSYRESDLFNEKDIIVISQGENCEPNTTYLDQGRYCLCPENGNTNFKLCTTIYKHNHVLKPIANSKMKIPTNATCKPNTFVDVDCNTCFCNKQGKIDPKWCTYDDCNSKKIIQDNHKAVRMPNRQSEYVDPQEKCIPGTISKSDCNFCICPESGILRERTCSKNICSEVEGEVADQTFICEPLAYYLIDCNICLCPRDGIKNVEKCTKKICDKTVLRSDDCTAGQFFSNDCNVCVCPPNGNKKDKVCTNHKCSDSDTPWKIIFSLSQRILENQSSQSRISKRNIEVCFYGEEFAVGCKICVCPDVELKAYAVCTEAMCEDQQGNTTSETFGTYGSKNSGEVSLRRTKRQTRPMCTSFNRTECPERELCTPGSSYIIRCRECICPYMGNINHFCRPLIEGTYCERAFPHFNYLPSGRRNEPGTDTKLPVTKAAVQTKYSCKKPGSIGDECFVCNCEPKEFILIEEHCFRSNAENCKDAQPTFLDRVNKIVIA